MIENKNNNRKDEIDIIEILKKIYNERKLIYKCIVISIVLGIIIIVGTPKEFKSDVTLLIETGSKSPGNSLLQQFGGLAGLNLNSLADQGALRPEHYPDVINSVPFLLKVLDQKVTESKYDSTLTVAEYLERHTKHSLLAILGDYTIGLPVKIIEWIKGESKANSSPAKMMQVARPTSKQISMVKSLSGHIKSEIGETNSILEISVTMQDPLVAASLTDSVVECLTEYIIDYQTKKAKVDLQFISKRHQEAEVRYFNAQRALAIYRDRNRNIILAAVKSEEERLQAEYNLSFNIYNTLSQQLEQAKIKVQEETPVFDVLNPSLVPDRKSKPKTILILISMTLFGGIIGIGIITIKLVIKNFLLNNRLIK